MTDVALTALFSTAGAALVAISGALATIYGPLWREQRQRVATALHLQHQARADATRDFLDSLTKVSPSQPRSTVNHALQSRHRLVATLLPGEHRVPDYLSWMLTTRTENHTVQDLDVYFSVGGDRLYEWLRGERNASRLIPFLVTEGQVVETAPLTIASNRS